MKPNGDRLDGNGQGGADRPVASSAVIALLLLGFIGVGAWLRLEAAQSQFRPNQYQRSDVYRYYVSPANSFLAGRGWVTDYPQNFIPAPLQGIFILAVKTLHPEASYGTIRRTQAWIGTLAIPLAFFVGAGMRNRWVGLLAAGFIAVDPSVVKTASLLLTESNYLVLLFGFLSVLLFALRKQKTSTSHIEGYDELGDGPGLW